MDNRVSTNVWITEPQDIHNPEDYQRIKLGFPEQSIIKNH